MGTSTKHVTVTWCWARCPSLGQPKEAISVCAGGGHAGHFNQHGRWGGGSSNTSQAFEHQLLTEGPSCWKVLSSVSSCHPVLSMSHCAEPGVTGGGRECCHIHRWGWRREDPGARPARLSLAPFLPWFFLRDDREKGAEGSTVRLVPPAPAVVSQASQPLIQVATALDPDLPFLSRWQ